MARGYGNYSYVADTSFNPFQSMQEMLVPFSAYKDTFERTEAAYDELTARSDRFKYLADNLDPESQAAQIYNNYADELNRQANDLAAHGLSMNNRRALTQLKRRYQGEIGRLDAADAAFQEEMKLRRQMDAKDGSMLYATNNLSIDDFLDNNRPNLYSVSGKELYSKGMQAGKAASSRIYSSGAGQGTLGDYYKVWVERNGYSPESIAAFRQNVDAIPELSKAVDDLLIEAGVDNLSDIDQLKARQSVINGIVDGAVYQEKSTPQRDYSIETASEKVTREKAENAQELSALNNGLVKQDDGTYKYDVRKDPKQAANLWMWDIDDDGNIKGYSQKFLDGMKEGLYTANGNPATSKQQTPPKQQMPTLYDRVRYDENGGLVGIKKTDSIEGEEITQEEAIKRFPKLEDKIRRHDSKYAGYYKYYVVNTGDRKKKHLVIEPDNTRIQRDFYDGKLQPSNEGNPQVPETPKQGANDPANRH